MSVRSISPIYARVYRTHTVASEIPMLHLVVSAHIHVASRCDKTRSLSRTCPCRVYLSSFAYTFVEGSVVSLQRGLLSLSPFLSLPLSRALRRLRRFRLRRATPPARRAFLSSLQPPQAPSSSCDRCPARLERVRWRSYRSSAFVSVALGLGRERDGAARLSPSNAARPCRPCPPCTSNGDSVASFTRSGSSSSHRRFSRCYRLPRDSFRSADEAIVTRG